MRSAFAVLVMGAGVAMGVAAADAAYSFTFGQASYDLLPGQSLQVPVYIQETSTTTLQTVGLFGTGVILQQTAPLGTPVATFSADDVQGTSQFRITNVIPSAEAGGGGWGGNPTAVKLAQVAVDPVATTTTDKIQLGWIEFNAGSLTGTTFFQAVADSESPENVLGDFMTVISVDPGAVAINVVPEAATLGLMLSASPLVLWRRRFGK